MKIEFVEIYVNFFDALSGVGEVDTIFFRADEEKWGLRRPKKMMETDENWEKLVKTG